jgi:hypothetical protein
MLKYYKKLEAVNAKIQIKDSPEKVYVSHMRIYIAKNTEESLQANYLKLFRYHKDYHLLQEREFILKTIENLKKKLIIIKKKNLTIIKNKNLTIIKNKKKINLFFKKFKLNYYRNYSDYLKLFFKNKLKIIFRIKSNLKF